MEYLLCSIILIILDIKKLANILDKEVEYPTEVNGVCLFEYDCKKGYFMCDYDKIWSILRINYSDNYMIICELICSWLKEHNKLCGLTPYSKDLLYINNLLKIELSKQRQLSIFKGTIK